MAASLTDVQNLGTAVREEFKALFDQLRGTHERIEKETVDLRALIKAESERLTGLVSDTHSNANTQYTDHTAVMKTELDGVKNLINDNTTKVAMLQGQFSTMVDQTVQQSIKGLEERVFTYLRKKYA